MISQYQYPQYPEQKPVQSKRIYFLLLLAVAVIVAVAFIFLRIPKSSNPVCGDDKCNSGENCYDCPQDCKCGTDEYCSEESKACVKPQCGNGKCEPSENTENCCDDCKCVLLGETCNKVTHKCEMPGVNVSDQRVNQLVTEYFKNQSKTVASMNITGIITWEGKLGKKVSVNITEEIWPSYVLVTEKEEVIELPLY